MPALFATTRRFWLSRGSHNWHAQWISRDKTRSWGTAMAGVQRGWPVCAHLLLLDFSLKAHDLFFVITSKEHYTCPNLNLRNYFAFTQTTSYAIRNPGLWGHCMRTGLSSPPSHRILLPEVLLPNRYQKKYYWVLWSSSILFLDPVSLSFPCPSTPALEQQFFPTLNSKTILT